MDIELLNKSGEVLRLANVGSLSLYSMSLHGLMRKWRLEGIDFTHSDFTSLVFAGLVEEGRIEEAEKILANKYSIQI